MVSRIVVLNHLTLDGVMQGPGRPDEDTRDGFQHGGWSVTDNDEVMGQAMGARMVQSSGLLLGRRSYEDMLAYWNTTDSPFADALNNAPKYVASHTSEPLAWPNSTLLTGDVPMAVAKLKQDEGNDLHIMGSGMLIQSLMPHGLIDEYMLMIHPIVLGSGHRMFQEGDPTTSLRLVDSVTTTKGVLIATYQPVDADQGGG